MITVDASGYEDDALFAEGVGFTDIVKRATPRAEGLRAEEYAHGRTELVRKLAEADAPLVIFTYKRTAEILFGRFSGAGLLSDRDVLPGEAFVMLGPYAPRVQVDATLDQLRDWLG